MRANSISKIIRRAAVAAALLIGAAVLPSGAQARDSFAFSGQFSDWGNSFGFGYRTGGGRPWGHHGWRGRNHFSLGFNYVIPPHYGYGSPYYYEPRPYYRGPVYYPRAYYPPALYRAYPAGGIVVFSSGMRDRLGVRTRGVYYDAYRNALAAPIGEPINWHDGRISGDVTTTRDGWAGERYCREFRQNIVVDGRSEEAYGTACQKPDGDWEIIPD